MKDSKIAAIFIAILIVILVIFFIYQHNEDQVWHFLWAALAGLVPAAIARNNRRDFFTWWVYGSMLWPVAILHSLLDRENQQCGARTAHESNAAKKEKL
jgi:hypothetical protein